MNILLIQPKLGDDFFKEVKLPPLGIAYIATALRKSHHNVQILDASLVKDQLREITTKINMFLPDMIGVSVSTLLMPIALEIAHHIKQLDKMCMTVFGGIHPTLFPKDVAKEHDVDYVVYGEGEATMVELVECLAQEKTPKHVLGVAYKDQGEIRVNAPRSLLPDLDRLPIPAYDLLPIHQYSSPLIAATPFMSMFTSRGCPYHCIFCDAHVVFERSYRFHSPERTIGEITYLVETFGVKEIIFKDSEFTLNHTRTHTFCDLMIQAQLPIRWSCNGRIGHMNLPLLKKMKDAGCRFVQYGIESGDQQILDRLKKQITVPQIKETFRLSRAAGVKTVANCMVGNPGENQVSIDKTIQLLKDIHADYGNFNPLIPFPGTELYNMAIQNGWLPKSSDIHSLVSSICAMNATQMADEELQRMLKKLYRAFYLRPEYFLKRMFTFSRHEWKMNIKGFLRMLGL